MKLRTTIKSTLLIALMTVSWGGLLLHLRVHPYDQNPTYIIPMLSGGLSVIVVPLLFFYKKTISYGYVLNGMLVILGTILMAHFALAHWPQPFTIGALIMKTTMADIIILWSKFLLGKALFDLEMFGYDEKRDKKGVFYRYPNMGWWGVHVVVISAVYYLSHVLWRHYA